jgi:hypothetical protein
LTKPIFYFLGGNGDVAYTPGESDYKNLKSVARWKGNLDVRLPLHLNIIDLLTPTTQVGHMATWNLTNGGKFGKAEVLWLDWMLRGNTKSSEFFLKGGAQAEGWAVEMADMEKIKISAIGGSAIGATA